MNYSKTVTIEELGRNLDSNLECEVSYDYIEAEPMVKYYPDGSGYPGCDAQCLLCEVEVLEYWSDTHKFIRKDRPDWFELLDKIAANHIENNWDEICEEFP